MSKKHIIITAAAGLLAFTGAFLTARLTGGGQQPAITEPNQPANGHATTEASGTSGYLGVIQAGGDAATQTATIKPISEKQLRSLVFDVRERIQQYNSKMKEIELREQRLQVVQDSLKKDIEELNNLRVEMASTVANLKQERENLLKAKVEVSQVEKANFTAIAATYDKMDATSASKILANMCMGQAGAANLDDAVKILFYMTERTKAKLLAEMVSVEPKLAALMSQKLKYISEGK